MKKIVVLAKQVPDTEHIFGNAMKEDGTVNRAALPAIFNPEDLNALEMALSIKEKLGHEVTVITMGPLKAAEILRHALYMGADKVYLISDRRFAGADTLATSYVLAEAIKKFSDVVTVLAGRQAIDGDTAQVGPQVAEKLDFNQVSYVSKLREIGDDSITVERDGEVQAEIIRTGFPVLLTVTSAANTPRYPNAHNMLKYFRADIPSNIPEEKLEEAERNDWIIPVLTLDDLGLDEERCGLKGSPTRVFAIKNITLTSGDLTLFGADPPGVKELIDQIIKDYVEVKE
ncbi:electron transfer flavoprotein subunit beta/FixA family protein [Nitrospinota bacterium]